MHRFAGKKMIPIFLMVLMLSLFSGALWGLNLQIHYINVQQGQSTLIIGPDGTTILYDGGYEFKGTNEVVPYLQSIGIPSTQALNYIIASHRDTDHFMGLTEVINSGYDALHVYDNGSDKYNTYVQSFLDAAATTTAGGVTALPLGTVFNLGDGATATCVAVNGSVIGKGAITGGQANENDRAVCLLIKYNNFDFVIGGDMGGGEEDSVCTGRGTSQINMESPMLQAIMPAGSNPLLSQYGVEVAHVGHHGSESSTNADYMNVLTPMVGCISVGAGQASNYYHPRVAVVENVLLAGASCITAPAALVLQTEEGNPSGASTSFAGYCVGDIVISTDGVNSYTVSADGAVSQGPDERVAAGLPVTYNFEEYSAVDNFPIIYNIHEESTDFTSTQIVWDTNETASSVVKYGTTTGSYTDTLSDASLLLNHSVAISGLTQSTTYYYVVESTDATSHTTTSPEHTFQTLTEVVDTITVTSPNGGESWLIGTAHNITWTSLGAVGSLNIDYSTDSGANWISVATGETNDGSYTWTIPDTASATCLVRVQETDGAPTDSSDAVFTITATLPVSGVIISGVYYDTIGTDAIEEWVEIYNNSATTWDISNWAIRDNNGAGTPATIPTGTTMAPGTYLTVALDQTGFRNIYGYDADIYRTGFLLGNGGDVVILKDSGGIEQDAVCWEDGFGSSKIHPPGWGSATLPSVGTGYAIVRSPVTTDTNTYLDWTSAPNNGNPHTLTARIIVTSSNGGESWMVGDSHDITWSSTGTVGNVNIDYSINSGTNWTSIATDEANDGSYAWTVPNTPSTTCLVRVQETDGIPTDKSNAVFTIVLPPTVTISGTILVGSSPLAGVVMSGLMGNPTTNASGFYTATVDYNWSGTVTPTLAGYTFSPENRVYTSVTSNQTAQDYTATLNTYTISGTILVGGSPLAGVVMSGLTDSPTTNASGVYSGIVTSGWSGTVTPTLTGYTFSPVNRTYTSVTTNQTTQDYTATVVVTTYTISGTVTASGSPLANVVMSGLTGNPTTDASGFYSGTVASGWSGTVTPTLAGYAFTPATRTYTNVIANSTNQNYTAAVSVTSVDFIGTWDGQGVYYRNSLTGLFVKLATPATLITAGDLDGDAIDDLIGIWPGQGGVWVKYSATGTWVKLSSTAMHIATGDMNGDGRPELLGTWDGQGVFWRNNTSGAWTKLATPATLITAGDLDGDGTDDLIGIWPSQGGVWVKYSQSGAWAKLSTTAVDIATGDMNGDGSAELLATWDGQGVYYRVNGTGAWVRMATPATQVTAGDLDGDGTDDVIGIWPGQGGVWVKYSQSGSWTKLSSTAIDIAAGRMRAAGSSSLMGPGSTAAASEGNWGPEASADAQDLSANAPGGMNFVCADGENLEPRESSNALYIPGPGEPGFTCQEQKNLVPGSVIIKREKSEENSKQQ